MLSAVKGVRIVCPEHEIWHHILFLPDEYSFTNVCRINDKFVVQLLTCCMIEEISKTEDVLDRHTELNYKRNEDEVNEFISVERRSESTQAYHDSSFQISISSHFEE
jgi:hypothetical protein